MDIINQTTLPAIVDSLPKVMEFLDGILEGVDCPMKDQMALDVALEEIYVNVASYAYPDENKDGKGMVKIIVAIKNVDEGCEITFIDQGIPYNPLKREDPDITLSAEERDIGGLGIYMVKKSMDSVNYSYEEGSNIFTIYKKFSR